MTSTGTNAPHHHPDPAPDVESIDPAPDAAQTPLPASESAAGSAGLTTDGRLKSGSLAGLTMGAAILTLSWPILAESVLNSLVGLTDTVLAAQISAEATDAIGGASYTLWFVGLIAMAIGVGATAMISRGVGASRMGIARAAVGQSILLSAIFSLLVAALMYATSAPLATLLSLQGEGRTAFVTYMRVMSAGVPGMYVLAACIAAFRGVGDSIRPLFAMILVNIVNVGCSWLLSGVDLRSTTLTPDGPVSRIILHNPAAHLLGGGLGVAGIGWGTVIAESVGAIVALIMLARGRARIQLIARRLLPHRTTIARLVRVGTPNFLETFGMWAGNYVIIVMVGWLALSGAEGSSSHGGLLGAHIVAIRIESFSYLPGFAMGAAAATLAGQYLGAKAPELARRAILRCALVTSIIMGVFGLVFLLFARTLVGWVSAQPEHLAIAPTLLMITGCVQIPFGLGIVLRSALRGAGDVRAVMYLTWISTYAVRLPLVYILSGVDIPLPGGHVIHNPFRDHPSLPWLWVGLCTEMVARGALFFWRFRSGLWTRARV